MVMQWPMLAYRDKLDKENGRFHEGELRKNTSFSKQENASQHEVHATSFTIFINEDCLDQIANFWLSHSLEEVESQTMLITKRLEVAAAEEEKDEGSKDFKMSGVDYVAIEPGDISQAERLSVINSKVKMRKLKLRRK